jgi:hypothetical protein
MLSAFVAAVVVTKLLVAIQIRVRSFSAVSTNEREEEPLA